MTRPGVPLAVTLPAHLVAAARRAVVEGRAPSMSAYVAEALADKVASDDLGRHLDQMLADALPAGDQLPGGRLRR